MAVVLVEFPCSFDGIISEMMAVGSERDFGLMTAGLVAMGWISDRPVVVIDPVVVEPTVEPVTAPAVVVDPVIVQPVVEPVSSFEPAAPVHLPRGKRK